MVTSSTSDPYTVVDVASDDGDNKLKYASFLFFVLINLKNRVTIQSFMYLFIIKKLER